MKGMQNEIRVISTFFAFSFHIYAKSELNVSFYRIPSKDGHNQWRIFTYKELHSATNGFSEDNKLGEGGFGSVFWGKTSDGLQV